MASLPNFKKQKELTLAAEVRRNAYMKHQKDLQNDRPARAGERVEQPQKQSSPVTPRKLRPEALRCEEVYELQMRLTGIGQAGVRHSSEYRLGTLA